VKGYIHFQMLSDSIEVRVTNDLHSPGRRYSISTSRHRSYPPMRADGYVAHVTTTSPNQMFTAGPRRTRLGAVIAALEQIDYFHQEEERE